MYKFATVALAIIVAFLIGSHHNSGSSGNSRYHYSGYSHYHHYSSSKYSHHYSH